MIDTASQNPNPLMSEIVGKILIDAKPFQLSITEFIIYTILLLILLCGITYFARTTLWINFASANKWKSRIAICALSLLAIFLTNTIGSYVGMQIKGKLRFGSPDVISTSLKLGSYGLLYNKQASALIPQEHRDLFYCTRALVNEDIKKLLEKYPDALDSNILIAPMTKESIFNQIKLLQASNNKMNPKLEPCLKVKIAEP